MMKERPAMVSWMRNGARPFPTQDKILRFARNDNDYLLICEMQPKVRGIHLDISEILKAKIAEGMGSPLIEQA